MVHKRIFCKGVNNDGRTCGSRATICGYCVRHFRKMIAEGKVKIDKGKIYGK